MIVNMISVILLLLSAALIFLGVNILMAAPSIMQEIAAILILLGATFLFVSSIVMDLLCAVLREIKKDKI